jgi:hypothetical protein
MKLCYLVVIDILIDDMEMLIFTAMLLGHKNFGTFCDAN